MSTEDQIARNIEWLQANSKSQDFITIGQAVNKLGTLSVTIANKAFEAYELSLTLEVEYKDKLNELELAYIEAKHAANRAEKMALAATKELRVNWTQAKITYKKLDGLLDRLDKICDNYKSYINSLKKEHKQA